jgi:hypothetical protein
MVWQNISSLASLTETIWWDSIKTDICSEDPGRETGEKAWEKQESRSWRPWFDSGLGHCSRFDPGPSPSTTTAFWANEPFMGAGSACPSSEV